MSISSSDESFDSNGISSISSPVAGAGAGGAGWLGLAGVVLARLIAKLMPESPGRYG